MKYRYYIGIDPGTNTGFALWDAKEKRFLTVESMKIHQAMQQISNLSNDELAMTMIRVEDARKRSGKMDKNILQGVGAVKAHCAIWEDFLTDLGANFEMCSPRKGLTKMEAEKFKLITGWKERSNNHARDAAMLVFGL